MRGSGRLVRGTEVLSVVQGAKPWQGVWETKSPRSWSTFSILYMKFKCHVTADVTKMHDCLKGILMKLLTFSTRCGNCGKSFKQSYLLKSALFILRQYSLQFLKPE